MKTKLDITDIQDNEHTVINFGHDPKNGDKRIYWDYQKQKEIPVYFKNGKWIRIDNNKPLTLTDPDVSLFY